ncbi:MAG: biopolymer transporter ExbD [Candidatus Aminicenantes bacterium]|nr:biopolymer transporter ExbD [Candidatus Aminicenantes bacterium]
MSHAAGSNGDKDVVSEINVVPLCDVLLVLLIIFMIATPLIQKGFDVQLPPALNTIQMPDNPEVVLAIKEDGTMFVNQDEATLDTLQLLVEEAFLVATDPKLYLKADGNLEYGSLVDIIHVLKNAGVEIVGIITEVKTERID